MRPTIEQKLNPRRLPGTTKAKARGFDREIARLRQEGYTFEAIREALADVGVHVSRSTVQREIVRHSKRLATGDQFGHISGGSQTPTVVPQPLPLTSTEPRSGKEIAESFFKGRITNPLARTRNST